MQSETKGITERLACAATRLRFSSGEDQKHNAADPGDHSTNREQRKRSSPLRRHVDWTEIPAFFFGRVGEALIRKGQ